MIVLHAGILDQCLLLWGETPPAEEASVRRGRTAKSAMRPSPFAAGAEALVAALQQGVTGLPDGAKLKPADCRKAVIWLPTINGAPVASSPLIAPAPELSEGFTSAPYEVTALSLTTEHILALLTACVGRDTLASGILLGSTLLYWTRALRYAGALLVRQEVVPDVAQIGTDYRARWQPVFVGKENEALVKLAQAMPSACRALSYDASAPPQLPAVSVLTDFLGALCDHLVRAASQQNATGTGQRARKSARQTFDSLHAQWLHALRTADGTLTGSASELATFAAQVREWQRPLTLSLAAPFRLCFRLEEPVLEEPNEENASSEWYVRYLLQSVQDPSLLIPVEQAWKVKNREAKSGGAKGREAIALQQDRFEPREFLLTALGQASRICPEVERSLKAARPAGYELDTAGAEEFLTEKAWLLEQSGFVVQLPAWWTRKGTKLRLTTHASVKAPRMQANAGLSLETVVAFDWEVALGDEVLTRQELEALARQKVSLVRMRGQWVQLDAREIEAALSFWKKQQEEQRASVRDVVRMALGAARAPGNLEITEVKASGWVADLLAQMQERDALAPIPPPPGLQAAMRPYQERGYSWLNFLGKWGLGACLADDMGLGKTLQTLAYIWQQWQENGGRPTLVICPTSVVGNWRREAQRFVPDLPVMVHHGLTRARGDEFASEAARHGLVLSSYALLHRDLEILKQVAWAGVVLDEAQNIKNPETRQSKAARALSADWKIALTGTPVENHVGDLWPIMDFLNPGMLGAQTEFRRAFFTPIQTNSDPDAANRLKRITQPFILRRLKTDRSIIADLPDKLEMKVYCTLTAEQASLYEAVVKQVAEALDEAEGIQRRGLVLATLSKLKQVCNHPAQFLGDNSPIPDRSGKLTRLTEMLEEVVEAGDKALIFTQFTEMGEIIRRHLQETYGKETLFLHGGVTKKQRDGMVERFQQTGKELPFFLLSLKAGGVGINLTAANHVFHFDRWWNPAVENQATDRAFRIGQKKNVQVHKFLCAGTLEEKIDQMIESKRQIATHVVGAGEDWLTELSTAELKDLFALRQDALSG
jgi:SNF2 family DNA or RNA helicase